MASELQTLHPRRAGIGAALNRMIPLVDDAEAKADRKLLRRLEIGKTLK